MQRVGDSPGVLSKGPLAWRDLSSWSLRDLAKQHRRPTLAKNARMGHAHWESCTQKIVKGGRLAHKEGPVHARHSAAAHQQATAG